MKKNKLLKTSVITSMAVLPIAAITPIIATTYSISENTSTTSSQSICEDITLYTTNDIHGRLLRNDDENVAGIKSIAGYVSKNKSDLLIDAGDLTQGTAINDLDYGKTAIEIAKLLGYDALGIGNHEFDFGLEQLKTNVSYASDLYLSANIVDKDSSEQLFNGHKIVTLDDYNLNIGLIGLTTPTTATQTKAESVKDVSFQDYVTTTKAEVQKLKEENPELNFIAVIAHSGLSYSKQIAEDPELSKDIDLIIDGHTHETYYEKIGNTHIFQSGSYTQGLRKTVLDFNKETGLIETFRTDMIEPLILKQYERYSSDEINQLVDTAEQKMNEVYGETVIENLPYMLEGTRTNVRSKETNLGNLIADSIYEGAVIELKAIGKVEAIDLALLNSGGIRQSINAGKVTKMDVYNCLPNQNLLSVVSVPGSTLKKILLTNKSIISGSTVFQVSKQVKMTVNSYSDISIQIWNDTNKQYENIDESRTYNVATIDYLTTSESGTYSLLNPTVTTGVSDLGTYKTITEYVETYMKDLSTNGGWDSYKEQLPNSRIIYNGDVISADALTVSPYELYFPVSNTTYTEMNGSNLLIDSYAYKAKELETDVNAAIIYNSSFRNYNSSTYPYLVGEISEQKIQKVVSSYATSNYLTTVNVPGLALKQMLETDLTNKSSNKSINFHYSSDIKATLKSDGTKTYQIKNNEGNFEDIQDEKLYKIATNNFNTTMSSNGYLNPSNWIKNNQDWCNAHTESNPSISNSYPNNFDLSLFTAMLPTLTTNDQWELYKDQYPNQRLVIETQITK